MTVKEYSEYVKNRGTDVVVNLGCGMRKPDGHFGIDIRLFKGVDFVANVGKDKIPFPDNSVDRIFADHLFEHLYPEELFFCMDECFRVIKPTGYLHVNVPLYGTRAWFSHPDHKIHFTRDTFGFFLPPAGGVDPHGYLKGFWHLDFQDCPNPENIEVDMYPNKKYIIKYPYKEIKL